MDIWKNNISKSLSLRTGVSCALIMMCELLGSPTNVMATPTVSLHSNNQQQVKKITVKGTVLDASGMPLPSVTIAVLGQTNMGAMTDIEGNFIINDVPADATLRISFIGMVTQEIQLKGQTSLKITLKEDTELLEEVVVVGYGSQKKVNLSGSVATVTSKELENRPIQNISSGIQGMMPGVTISGVNGAPGQDSGDIRVRGIGTLNTASPYILVDGVETESLSSVDPNDIESISVLKDAASAAIYGSKAANGVILITTKRGKEGKISVSYSGYMSVQNATNLVERMGSHEYASIYNRLLTEAGKQARFTEEELQKFANGSDPERYPNTDWYGLAFKTGIQHRHNLNINGGTEKIRYMGSLGYLNQTGILPNAGREQFNARTNLDMNLTKRLTSHINLSYTKNQYTEPNNSYVGGGVDQVIRQLNITAPWITARYNNGTWGTTSDGSPIAWLDNKLNIDRDNYLFSGLASLDYKIIDGLVLTLQGAYNNGLQHFKEFRPYFRYNATKTTAPNFLNEFYSFWSRTNYDALLNYYKSFGSHNIKVLLGSHSEYYIFNTLSGERKKFPSNDLTDMDAGEVATQKNGGKSRELKMLSWFGRLNYDYAGKYLFEANLRADGSSRFTAGHRWGYFPSFSAAWRISEEDFMESLRDSWLNNLKIRASWGILGNQDALNDYYPALNTYKIDASYPIDGTLETGYYQKDYKLNTITWERSINKGLGLDFTLFKGLSGSIDLYDRTTKGIIMKVITPDEFALGSYFDNVGSVSNKGIELSFNYRTNIKEVGLNIGGNLAYNKNKVLDLGDDNPDKYLNGHYNTRHKVGLPLNTFYGYKTDGLVSTEELGGYTQKYGETLFGSKVQAGDIKYVDINNDGKINSEDREYLGTIDPSFTFGFNIGLNWKGFDLSMLFNGVLDAYRYFTPLEVYGTFNGDATHPSTIWREAWRPDHQNAKMPRIELGKNTPNIKVVSDYWLQNISYVRLKNLQLGYSLPKHLTDAMGIGTIRVFYSAENLFTIDKMKLSVDPEATGARLSSYPLLRTHAVGLNIMF